MPILIIAVIAIIIVFVAISLLQLVLTAILEFFNFIGDILSIAIECLPIIFLFCVIIFVIKKSLEFIIISRLEYRDILPKMIFFAFEKGKLKYSISYSIDEYSHDFLTLIISIMSGGYIGWFLLSYEFNYDFVPVMNAWAYFYFGLSFFIFIFVMRGSSWNAIHRKAQTYASEVVLRVEKSFARAETIKNNEVKIQSILSQIGVSISTNFYDSIKHYAEKNQKYLLRNTKYFDKKIAKTINITNIYRKKTEYLSGLHSQIQKKINAIISLTSTLKISYDIKQFKQFNSCILKEMSFKDKIELLQKNLLYTNDLVEIIENNLKKSTQLYKSAHDLYNNIIPIVNNTFSIPLIKELEYIYEGLTSSNLLELLSKNKWEDFNDVVNLMIQSLEKLKMLALKYTENDSQFDFEDNDEFYESDEEKAYRVLELDDTASPSDITKQYKMLAREFHPDRAISNSLKKYAEERMKELNWAHDFLKNKTF